MISSIKNKFLEAKIYARLGGLKSSKSGFVWGIKHTSALESDTHPKKNGRKRRKVKFQTWQILLPKEKTWYYSPKT